MILITVSSNTGFHRETSEALDGHFRFNAVWKAGYHETARLRAAMPDDKYLVVIDFEHPEQAFEVAKAVDGRPELACIAIGAGSTREELLRMMQAGIRDVLAGYSREELLLAVRRTVAKLASAEEMTGKVYSFVPAKPGCGATTIATHATAAAARMSNDPTLLLDFDIRLGVTSFLLKAEGNHTIVDALQQSHRLDHNLWSSLVSQCGNLHLVGSGPVDFSSPVPVERFGEVLSFATQKYALVAVDLPGSMEEYEAETLQRSKGIFLVCSPDIGALHVARRKSNWLRELGLADKVSVVLNRLERRSSLGVADIERVIQMPVQYVVPAGTAEVTRALQKGSPIEGSSALAKQVGKIAASMAAVLPPAKKPSPVRRFVEYFSISPAREEQRL